MFYLVQIQKLSDETEAKALFSYEDYNDVLSAFYQGVASSIANTNIISFMFEILDGFGNVNKIERWDRPEPEPTE